MTGSNPGIRRCRALSYGRIFMMRRARLLFLVQLVYLLGIFSSAEAIKPLPPVQLSLLEARLSDKESRLILTATANVDSSQVQLSIDLPPDLVLTEGEESWEGPLKKGASQTIEMIVESRNHTPQKVIGKAIVHFDQGETFVQRNTLILNSPEGGPPLPAPSIKRKDKESILEFKGK